MKYRTLLFLFPVLLGLICAPALMAQEPDSDQEEWTEEVESNEKYGDYQVKAYRLSGFYGSFSGATYLDNKELGTRTVLTPGSYDILGYNGEVLWQSTAQYENGVHIYDAAQKEIQSGPAFGGRIGIYISNDFHLDLLGTYATSKAVTTMLYRPNPEDITINERVVVDEDDSFKMIKGGLALMYDANPAAFFNIVPRLGFGLGGVINRYNSLEDKTALYLEGNFGLHYELFKNFSLTGQVDLTVFAYQVDELGYSNMVNYTTWSIGAAWFIDVVPSSVRAAHLAELRAAEE